MIARRLSDAQYFLAQSIRCFDLARQESDDPSMDKALRQASEHCSALRGVVVRQLDRLAPVDGEKAL